MIEGLRNMPPWKRLEGVERSRHLMKQLVLGRLRQQNPYMGARELRLAAAESWLGPQTFERVRDRLTPEDRPMDDGSTAALLTKLCEVFDRLGIDYAVGGSLASSLHGERRFTNDVDIVAAVKVSDVDPLSRELASGFYAEPDAMREAIKRGECFNVIDLDTFDKADIFVAATPFAEREITRAELVPIGPDPGDPRLRFVTPEDIILSKLRWYRLGGGVSERQITDVIGVMRVQSGTLDLAYLRHWADELDVRELLEDGLRQAVPHTST